MNRSFYANNQSDTVRQKKIILNFFRNGNALWTTQKKMEWLVGTFCLTIYLPKSVLERFNAIITLVYPTKHSTST